MVKINNFMYYLNKIAFLLGVMLVSITTSAWGQPAPALRAVERLHGWRKTPPVEEGVASGEASAPHLAVALVPEHAIRRHFKISPRRLACAPWSGSGLGLLPRCLPNR